MTFVDGNNKGNVMPSFFTFIHLLVLLLPPPPLNSQHLTGSPGFRKVREIKKKEERETDVLVIIRIAEKLYVAYSKSY